MGYRAAIVLAGFLAAGCTMMQRDTPQSFMVFFAGHSTDLTPAGADIVKHAADSIRASHPKSVLISAGVRTGTNMDLSEPRFSAVRAALVADGVAPDKIARSAIPGPELTDSKTGDQRVEIRLLNNGQ